MKLIELLNEKNGSHAEKKQFISYLKRKWKFVSVRTYTDKGQEIVEFVFDMYERYSEFKAYASDYAEKAKKGNVNIISVDPDDMVVRTILTPSDIVIKNKTVNAKNKVQSPKAIRQEKWKKNC